MGESGVGKGEFQMKVPFTTPLYCVVDGLEMMFHSMPVIVASLRNIMSSKGKVAAVIVVGVASNAIVKLVESDGVSVATVVLPNDMVMSHDVISVPGRAVPVAPFVVIVPVTVYPFWSVG
jgi:hypothetical protein